jgi:peptide chain release factor subunit 1
MLIRADQIDRLVRFEGEGFLTTSCYLNTDGSRFSARDTERALKELLREAREILAGMEGLSREVERSVEEDLERIREHVQVRFERKGHRGLALFSCSSQGLWRAFPLPSPIPSGVVLDETPYIRPLSSMLDEHSRYCAVIVDREKARLFEVYLGEIEEASGVLSDIPKQVRSGGWYGLEEKRIHRYVEGQVHRHYKEVAEHTFHHFRSHGFDWLALGGHRDALPEFEGFLHAYLQERLAGRFEADIQTPAQEVLRLVRAIETRVEAEGERALLDRVVTDASKGGLAVLGLEPTLDALHRGAVHTLLVDSEWRSSGARCKGCGRLTAQEGECPSCGASERQALPHLVDKAIEQAVHQGSRIEHVYSLGDELRRHGALAAVLRFRL